jgi:hypothetical protein
MRSLSSTRPVRETLGAQRGGAAADNVSWIRDLSASRAVDKTALDNELAVMTEVTRPDIPSITYFTKISFFTW